jgi:hypothetical protein
MTDRNLTNVTRGAGPQPPTGSKTVGSGAARKTRYVLTAMSRRIDLMDITKLKHDLLRLDGKNPYKNTPDNTHQNDPNFIKQMEAEYGYPLKKLREIARGSL